MRHTALAAQFLIMICILYTFVLLMTRSTYYTGQQNLTFFLAHEGKYLILIELLTLNSNV